MQVIDQVNQRPFSLSAKYRDLIHAFNWQTAGEIRNPEMIVGFELHLFSDEYKTIN